MREQLRSVGLALRREGVIFAAVLLLMVWQMAASIAAMLRHVDTDPSHHWRGTNVVFETELAILVAIAAFLLPRAVWRGEPAARRWYRAAMPVDEPDHTLTRAAAGWGWLMVGVLVFDLALVAVSVIGTRMASGTPLVVAYPHAPGKAWQWLVPFTAATVAYLFGSAFVLASRHPWRWVLGIVIGYILAFSVISEYVAPGPNAWRAYDLLKGDLGLYATITGQTGVLRTSPVFHTADGQALLYTGWSPDVRTWLLGTLLWGAAGARCSGTRSGGGARWRERVRATAALRSSRVGGAVRGERACAVIGPVESPLGVVARHPEGAFNRATVIPQEPHRRWGECRDLLSRAGGWPRDRDSRSRHSLAALAPAG
ncbi:MAG TPA: hypothetical protein VFS08_17005 [Gemmatimonadaceae bacterium]|nr:hypothetical protein [Gemmatimonadaceae bacterium]